MKNIILLFLACSIIGSKAFNCSDSTGMYGNSDDHRSFYVCNNYCPSLEYCQSSKPYYSNRTRDCLSEPNNWIPRYYLSGTATSYTSISSMLYVRQDGYHLLWTTDDSGATETFTGQYINETHVRGIHVRRLSTTNCINIFDVKIIASADRKYCATYTLHPQSALCDLSYPYVFDYCRTLSP